MKPHKIKFIGLIEKRLSESLFHVYKNSVKPIYSHVKKRNSTKYLVGTNLYLNENGCTIIILKNGRCVVIGNDTNKINKIASRYKIRNLSEYKRFYRVRLQNIDIIKTYNKIIESGSNIVMKLRQRTLTIKIDEDTFLIRRNFAYIIAKDDEHAEYLKNILIRLLTNYGVKDIKTYEYIEIKNIAEYMKRMGDLYA